jgi:hypothetical protein
VAVRGKIANTSEESTGGIVILPGITSLRMLIHAILKYAKNPRNGNNSRISQCKGSAATVNFFQNLNVKTPLKLSGPVTNFTNIKIKL